jgi:hypothetical protein
MCELSVGRVWERDVGVRIGVWELGPEDSEEPMDLCK